MVLSCYNAVMLPAVVQVTSCYWTPPVSVWIALGLWCLQKQGLLPTVGLDWNHVDIALTYPDITKTGDGYGKGMA